MPPHKKRLLCFSISQWHVLFTPLLHMTETWTLLRLEERTHLGKMCALFILEAVSTCTK